MNAAPRTHLRTVALLLTAAACLGAGPSRASYYNLTKETPEAQECITFDARYPYFTNGVYIATYPHHSRSKEGWDAPYYGGVVTKDKENQTLLQFASWQMSGKGAPASGIDFVTAGPHMSWKRSNWEGSSGGIKGDWPETEFKRNQWYRFIHRVWTPTSPSPGLGFAGVWMKSLDTGVWYHLATFKFPAELTGFNAMGGFHERFAGNNSSQSSAVEFRNSYALRSGKWTSEADFNSTNAGDDTVKLTLSGDRRAVLMETKANELDPATRKPAKGPVVRQTLAFEQPAQPDFFDPVAVEKVTAEIGGGRVAVRWKVDMRNSPQLGYEVTLLQGNQPIAAEKRNDPEVRLCVLDLPAGVKPPLTARVRITDIFGRASSEVSVPVPASVPLPPIAVATTNIGFCGLAYRYFETATPADWMALPDFTKLASVREGIVRTPDITPRLRRDGYAFEFTGYLAAPESALYTFSLTGASALKMFIDGRTVIDADGYHSIACYKEAVPLLAGLHVFRLLYAQGPVQQTQQDDFLQLSWARPGSPDEPIPMSGYRCRSESVEPKIAVAASAAGVNLSLKSNFEAGSHKVDRVEYFAQDAEFDYFTWQNAKAMDYFLASSPTPGTPVTAAVWGGPRKTIRARLVYDGNRTVDSLPVTVNQKAASDPADGFHLSSLEHHLYPVGVEHTKETLSIVGDSMALYTRPHKGDVTLIAHLASITPDQAIADGTRPKDAANWFSGIILRANTNPRPGEPLGGTQIPFSAIMGAATDATRHCDSTMINGAGNQPSGNIGSELKWFKLVRRGADITTYASNDGAEWKLIKTVNLPKLPEECEIGFVHYSIPSATPIVHRATFDHISVEP